MSPHVVQVNFNYTMPYEQLDAYLHTTTEVFASLPGLNWKIWMHSPSEQRFGGIYLFESEESANAFVNGPVADSVRNGEGLENVDIRAFSVVEDLSLATRAPIQSMVAAD